MTLTRQAKWTVRKTSLSTTLFTKNSTRIDLAVKLASDTKNYFLPAPWHSRVGPSLLPNNVNK